MQRRRTRVFLSLVTSVSVVIVIFLNQDPAKTAAKAIENRMRSSIRTTTLMKSSRQVDGLFEPAIVTSDGLRRPATGGDERKSALKDSLPELKSECLQDPKTTQRRYETNNAEIARRRGELLREACIRQNSSISTDFRKLDHVLVNDEYKLLYCFIPKIASTNVHVMFQSFSGSNASIHEQKYRKMVPKLSNFHYDEALYRTKTYLKVIVVRDTFERLVSVFKGKFEEYRYRYPLVEREKAKMIQLLNIKTSGDIKEFNATFANFIDYILKLTSLGESLDEHWATYNDLCDPCLVNYNFVGSYETINDDMHQILKEIGASTFVKLRGGNANKRGKTQTACLLDEYYKDIPREKVNKLKSVYADDYLLFGYKYPDALEDN